MRKLAAIGLLLTISSTASAQDVAGVVAKARGQLENGDFAKALSTLALLQGQDLPQAVAVEAGLLATSAKLVVEGEDAAIQACKAAVVSADYDPDVAGDLSPKVRAACKKAAVAVRAERAQEVSVDRFEVDAPKVAYQPVRLEAEMSEQPEWLRVVARIRSSAVEGSFDLPLVPAEGETLRATMDPSWIQPESDLSVSLVFQDRFGDVGDAQAKKKIEVPEAEAMIALGKLPASAVVEVDGDRVNVAPGGLVAVSAGAHTVDLTLPDGRSASADVEVRRGTVSRVALAPQEGSTTAAVGWIFAGTSVACLGVGTVMLILADNRRGDLEDAAAEREPGTDLPANDYAELASIEDERQTFSTTGTVFMIAGGVTAAAALTFWLWPSGSDGDSAWVRPSIGPGYLGAAGSF